VPALITANPYATYARIAALLHPEVRWPAGIDAGARLGERVQVAASASIAAGVVIEPEVRIGERARIGPGCVIMTGSVIGDDTRLSANVTICRGVSIGARVLIHPGAVIGADGFGLAPERGAWVKVPQIGSVRIGDDVEIGTNTCIDRGAIEDTVIGDGVKMDNMVQIAHGVRVGAHTAMAGQSGIAGSTTVGQRCMIGGQVGVAGGITICDDVYVTGKSFVSSSVHKPGYYSSSLTVDEAARFRKNAARFHQLDDLAREVRKLRGAPEQDESGGEDGEPRGE
jgi:UDP-3-O-[3-hydroxymyristoyl] glucosamine N-acyltransferase